MRSLNKAFIQSAFALMLPCEYSENHKQLLRHNTQTCFVLTNLLFSIISYGITTEIKLQSNHHIKIYPYYLLSKSARVDLCSFKNEDTKLNKTN